MLSTSFTWFLINFGITIIWVAGSIVSHNYFLAIGGLVYAGFMMLIELPGTSSEEGSADPLPKLVYPPESTTTAPYHSEEELTGDSSQGTWRGSGPPPSS